MGNKFKQSLALGLGMLLTYMALFIILIRLGVSSPQASVASVLIVTCVFILPRLI